MAPHTHAPAIATHAIAIRILTTNITNITRKVAIVINAKNITGPTAAIKRVVFVTEQSVLLQTIFAKMISPTTVISKPITHSAIIMLPSIDSSLISVMILPAVPNNVQEPTTVMAIAKVKKREFFNPLIKPPFKDSIPYIVLSIEAASLGIEAATESG